MKLIIKEACLGPKDQHLEVGKTVDVDTTIAQILIGNGKAYSAESRNGKELAATIETQAAEHATAKPKK